jgi:hypothetical protein
MGTYLNHADFVEHVNTTFRVLLDSEDSVELKLTQLSELKVTPQQERFSVTFRGPREPYLGQGTRHFIHDQIGEFDLFIVPIGMDDDGVIYDASFNRLIPR